MQYTPSTNVTVKAYPASGNAIKTLLFKVVYGEIGVAELPSEISMNVTLTSSDKLKMLSDNTNQMELFEVTSGANKGKYILVANRDIGSTFDMGF